MDVAVQDRTVIVTIADGAKLQLGLKEARGLAQDLLAAVGEAPEAEDEEIYQKPLG